MELEEHFHPDEPPEDEALATSEACDCTDCVDAYEF